jgi:hypothetical protein
MRSGRISTKQRSSKQNELDDKTNERTWFMRRDDSLQPLRLLTQPYDMMNNHSSVAKLQRSCCELCH